MGKQLRVLIGCERSGVMRDAFERFGWLAYSCDTSPTETPGNHYQGNLLDILDGYWDLVIAHPPCQYLSFAGNRWRGLPERIRAAEHAKHFFLAIWHSQVSRLCIENPTGSPNVFLRKPDQVIHPYYFGDSAMKRTCLWLRGLPILYHQQEKTLFDPQTHVKKPGEVYLRGGSGRKIHWTESVHGSVERSKTFPGIANAAAEQWTEYILRRKTV